MKYFLDTEFIEDGKTIDLLSLALVAEDGRELYALNSLADISKANAWVRKNVIPYLEAVLPVAGPDFGGPPSKIAVAVASFVFVDGKQPEFWGYYSDYDWVAFCQLFGTMMDLPKGFPMYCRDIKQWCDQLGNPKLPEQGKGEHNALLDARWNKAAYEFLVEHDAKRVRP